MEVGSLDEGGPGNMKSDWTTFLHESVYKNLHLSVFIRLTTIHVGPDFWFDLLSYKRLSGTLPRDDSEGRVRDAPEWRSFI